MNYPVMLGESRKPKAVRADDRPRVSGRKLIKAEQAILATPVFSVAQLHVGKCRPETPLLGKNTLFAVPTLGGIRRTFRLKAGL